MIRHAELRTLENLPVPGFTVASESTSWMAKLPPGTPMFGDIVNLGFRQVFAQ